MSDQFSANIDNQASNDTTAYVRDRAPVLRMATCDKTAGSYVVGSNFAAGVLEFGGYDGVAIQSSDLYRAQFVSKKAYGVRTVSCGVESQFLGSTGVERPPSKMGVPMGNVMLRNLAIVGNCLGRTENSAGAVSHDADGLFPVTTDSVSCNDFAGVLGRLQTLFDRFGKFGFFHA